MMHTFLLACSLFSLLLITGCQSNSVAPEGRICVEVVGDELVIINHTRQPLHYATFGSEITALINWVAWCGDRNGLPPNQSVRIKLSDIYGYRPDDTVSLYWWNCANRQENNAVSPEQIQSVIVRVDPLAGAQCETVR